MEEQNSQDSLFGNEANTPDGNKETNKAPEPVNDENSVPAENKKNLLDFSYSRMDMFKTCPLKYKFRYIDKIKEKPKGFFFFGSAIHAALEFLYKGDSRVFPTVEQVCQAFLEFWFSKPLSQQGFRNPEEAARKRGEGLAMLREYYRVNKDSFTRAFLTEKIFKFEIDGLLVTAISDRMDYVGNGKLLITDYKTGKDVRRTPNQLYMYQKIAEANPELPELLAERLGVKTNDLKISQMLYYHVPTNKKYYFDRASDDEIKRFWDMALATADEMRSGNFEPSPSEFACRWCDYKQYCPIYGGTGKAPESVLENNRYEENAENSYGRSRNTSDSPKKESTESNNGPDAQDKPIIISADTSLTQLLNRYGDMEERKNVIEREQEMIRQRIAEMELSKGEYSTSQYIASIGTKQAWKADSRNDVIDLLNEYNLYNQACTLTMSGILSLMNNRSLPHSFKDRLKRLLRKEISCQIEIRRQEEKKR